MNESTIKSMKGQVKEVKPIQPGYLRPKSAALYLGINLQTLKDRMSAGTAPKHFKLSSRCVLFKISDIEEWIEEYRVRGG